MFCGNCGTNNQDGVPFCGNCGAPLAANPQNVPAPEAPAPAAPKKNLLPIIIGAAAVVVVVILLIVLLSGGVNSSPEDAALAYVEGTVLCDADLRVSAKYPGVYSDKEIEDLEETYEKEKEIMDRLDGDAYDFEVTNIRSVDEDEYDEWEEDYKREYDLDIEITAMERITVTYTTSVGDIESTDSRTVYVMEVDGDWYVA